MNAFKSYTGSDRFRKYCELRSQNVSCDFDGQLTFGFEADYSLVCHFVGDSWIFCYE